MTATGGAQLVRLRVARDPDDPLLFLVAADPGEDSIPVIPTGDAHRYWVGASVLADRDDPERHVSPNHPSVISRAGPGTG